MAAYGVKQARIHKPGHPEAPLCRECEDTGFVQSVEGLRECRCQSTAEEVEHVSEL